MATIQVFCTMPELESWIKELSIVKKLDILPFGGFQSGLIVSGPEFEMDEGVYQLFMFAQGSVNPSELDQSKIRQRDWGWLYVRTGRLTRSGLQSSLSKTSIDGDKSLQQVNQPVQWMGWLKRKVKSQVHYGVRGTNIVFGGSSDYKYLGYTDEARILLSEGVKWKQSPNDNAEFEPIAE